MPVRVRRVCTPQRGCACELTKNTWRQEVLWDTINAQGVIAQTIFQSLANVERGVWNISQPNFS